MNLFKSLGSGAWQILKTVAPTIAATAAGPFGPLVGPIMAKIFGSADPTTLDTALVNATPEQLLALKQAENAHIEKLAELGIARDKLAFDDTASARTMEEQTHDATPGYLAWLIIGGFLLMAAFEVVAMIVWPTRWAEIPSAAMGVMGVIFGYLANEAKQAASFYFGSSSESRSKDQTLAEIAKS